MRLPASGKPAQAVISSMVLRQPSHQPVVASMRQRDTQGDGTVPAC
jgi:hypothetical protein